MISFEALSVSLETHRTETATTLAVVVRGLKVLADMISTQSEMLYEIMEAAADLDDTALDEVLARIECGVQNNNENSGKIITEVAGLRGALVNVVC